MNNNKLNSLINSYQKSQEIIHLNLSQTGGETETETLDNIDLLSKMLIHEEKDENEYTKSLLKQYVDLEN
jgi:hypothetical protein